jgi:AcrR family transcriptional regulator
MTEENKLKQERDPKAKLQKILAAAQTLFARDGYSGASMGKIAKLADINKSLLYHYYESKADLWNDVKNNLCIEPDSNWIHEVFKAQDLKEFISRLVMSRYRILKNNPELRRMIYWQRLEFKESDLEVKWSLGLDAWQDTYDRLKSEGELKKTVALKHLMLYVSYSMEGVFDESSPMSISSEADKEAYLDFVIDGCYLALKA